jgi:uncharacterized protein YycO
MPLLRFTRGEGLYGYIIRLGTFSDFSHVGFKLDDGLVLDATPTYGVSVREAKDDDTTQYYRILAPRKYMEAALSYAMLQVGRPYDWSAVWGTIIRRDWCDDCKFFCSELVESAFSQAHYPLVRDSKHFNRITPRDLLLSPRIRQVIPPNGQ